MRSRVFHARPDPRRMPQKYVEFAQQGCDCLVSARFLYNNNSNLNKVPQRCNKGNPMASREEKSMGLVRTRSNVSHDLSQGDSNVTPMLRSHEGCAIIVPVSAHIFLENGNNSAEVERSVFGRLSLDQIFPKSPCSGVDILPVMYEESAQNRSTPLFERKARYV